MKPNVDLTKVLSKQHEEKWVALPKTQDRVLAFAEKLPELKKKLGTGQKDVVYLKVPRSDTEYAF